MKIGLTIIIPTYNNTRGLKCLLNYFRGKPYKVVVVDNQPNEEKKKIVELVKSVKSVESVESGKIIYLPQEKNLGFAIAVNRGAKDVKTKWMLVLNDDIEFQSTKIQIPRNKQDPNNKSQIKNEETIQRLINFAEKNSLDAVSPILRNPDGEVENYGYRLLSIGKIELIKEIPRSKFQETNKSKNPNPKQKILNTKYEILDTDIDGITAACLLVRTEVFKKLGGFDESFFAYLEDVDFFLRLATLAQDRSFGIAYDVEVLHNHMTTTKTMGNFKARQDMVNWWRLFFKHPEKFKFNLDFIIERLRNVLGFVKASLM